MPTSLVHNESILAIEVDAATTRAVLFDVVEGQYRLVALGKAPSTAEAPFKNIGIGIREAIESLETITGAPILGQDNNLIVPSRPDGSGVDAVVAVISAGPVIRTVVVGLLSNVSSVSARNLAESTYTRIVDELDLSDRRKPDQQMDSIVRSRPDLVILTGGTNGGASRSMLKMLEAVGLACYLMPIEKRPMVLYAGNANLAKDVQELLGGHVSNLKVSQNARPRIELEDLRPASSDLASMVVDLRHKQIKGMEELKTWTGGATLPSSYAQGRMIRFLSRLYGSKRGLLSVNIDASAASVAAGFEDDLVLRTYPQYGLGENLTGLPYQSSMEDIQRWLSMDVPTSTVQDFLTQKSQYPSTLPGTSEDFAVSQAVTRQALYLAVRAAQKDFPGGLIAPTGAMKHLDLIIAGGALTDGMSLGQSTLLLLDAIQPIGAVPILIDQNNLLPLLGVAALKNNFLPMQVIDSGSFTGLGTVISVVASAKYGELILHAKLTYKDGTDTRVEVKFGGLEILPLPSGETARLSVQPLRKADAGLGPGRSGNITVTGGAMGVIIDARGRPLQLPSDAARRRDLIKKWNLAVGG